MATYQEQIEKRRREKEAREKSEAENKARQLTPDQVSHWRLVLANMGIPFAMSMPETMVQNFRDVIQMRLNAEFKAGNDGESNDG